MIRSVLLAAAGYVAWNLFKRVVDENQPSLPVHRSNGRAARMQSPTGVNGDRRNG